MWNSLHDQYPYFAAMAVAVVVAIATGCYDGELGDSCSRDFDCPFGTRCLDLEDGSNVCTVRCDGEPCESGHCITTQYGEACAAGCDSDADCSGDLRCSRVDASTTYVCWGDDPHLIGVGDEGIAIDEIEIASDTTGDGKITPGEEIVVDLHARNFGSEEITIEYAEVNTESQELLFAEDPPRYACESAYTSSLNCDLQARSCGCTFGEQTTLEPGERTDAPFLSFGFQLDAAAEATEIPFEVQIEQSGQEAPTVDSLTLYVEESSSAIEVDDASISYDSAGDGRLAPGQEGVITVDARNMGETNVTDLTAKVSIRTPDITVVSPPGRPECSSSHAIVSDCSYGDSFCECNTSADAAPGEVTEGILHVGIDIPEQFSASEIEFDAYFEDSVTGNSSSDDFSIEVHHQ